LFDNHKLPYHKKFAEYIDDTKEFLNIPILDLISDYDNIKDFDYFENILNSLVEENEENEERRKLINNFIKTYDLSNIEFKKPQVRPLFHSCDEDYENKLYYNCHVTNPEQYNQVFFSADYIDNQVLGWRPEGGHIESYWLLQTPYICGDFTRNTRIYMEYIGGSLCNFSQIYADTVAAVPSVISIGHEYYRDDELLCYYEGKYHNSLAYHFFNDGIFENDIERIKQSDSLNHTRYDFKDVDEEDEEDEGNEKNVFDFHTIGQNRLLGDKPTRGKGIALTDIISHLCKYGRESVDYSESLFDIDFDDPIELGVNEFVSHIFFTIECTSEIEESINKLSILIDGNIISNLFIPRMKTGEKLDKQLFIGYYGGRELKILVEDAIKDKVTINDNVKLWIFGQALRDYKVKSEQPSVVFNREGMVLIFFYNELDQNISCFVSCDNGESWTPYHNLIRLFGDEIATLPYALPEYKRGIIKLFYVLNGEYLMCKKIDTSRFRARDSFKTYTRLDSYSDSAFEDVEEYSNQGKIMRASTSYFVVGDSDSNYYRMQKEVFNNIQEKNENSSEQNKINIDVTKIPRFHFNEDNEDSLNNDFDNKSYFVYNDNYGNTRLFYIKDNKLNIKRSSNFINWTYDVEGIDIHKNFITDDIHKKNIVISTIQVARFKFKNNIWGLIYISGGMMFIRYMQSDILSHDAEELRKHLSISNDKKDNVPIFLVGELSNKLKESLKNDFDNDIKYEDSDRLVYFPYGKDMIDKFDDRLSIDSETQPSAYKLREGLNRIFYKDKNGNLNALLINGTHDIKLECMFKDK
ncbi:MAG: hypothetical protein ACOCRK_09270, partial [bacterium]